MSVITIKTGTGTEVSFEQEPKPVNLTSGPLEGDKVTIFYSHKPGETIYVPELIQYLKAAKMQRNCRTAAG